MAMRMNKIQDLLTSLSSRELRQLAIWAVLTLIFTAVIIYGHVVGVSGQSTWEYLVLYSINSVIFLSLFRQYQGLGTTMLAYTIFFELSIFGYYFFSAASLNG